jgi:hypothetical protein
MIGTLAPYNGGAGPGANDWDPQSAAAYNAATNINTPCTIECAMINAVAGDVVGFRGGTYLHDGVEPPSYQGVYQPTNSGIAGSPIIFAAYTGETPNVSITSGLTNQWALATNARNYITWDGFTTSTTNNRISGMFIGGQTFNTGCIAKNNTCVFPDTTVQVTINDNADICRMERTIDSKFINNRVGGGNWIGFSDNYGCLKLYRNSGLEVAYNEFFGMPGVGIVAKSVLDNSEVHHNFVHDCGQGFRINIYLSQLHPNNIVHNNLLVNLDRSALDWQSDSDSEPANATNQIVYNNTMYTAAVSGMVGMGQCVLFKFYNNVMQYPNATSDGKWNAKHTQSSVDEMDHNQFGTGVFIVEINRYTAGKIRGYNQLASWKTSTPDYGSGPPLVGGELSGGGGGDPGVGSLASDPQFLNGSGTLSDLEDFRFAPGSPCIGAGRAGVDMGCDIDAILNNLGPQ